MGALGPGVAGDRGWPGRTGPGRPQVRGGWSQVRGGGRRPAPRRRILSALAPRFRAAEQRPSRAPRERPGVGSPGRDDRLQPGLDLVELRPALEWPTGLETDPHQRPLREHHVGIACGIAVRLPVADEHDRAPRRLMGKHPVPLARAANTTGRIAVGERDRRTLAGERGPGGDYRQLRHTEGLEGRLDEEPEPIRHDLDRDPDGLRAADERHETLVVRLGGRRREQICLGNVDQPDLELHEPARTSQTGVIGRDLRLPGTGHVFRHHRVRDIGQGHRPVVVDEDRQGQLTRKQRGDGRRHSVWRDHRGRPAMTRRTRLPVGQAPRRSKATPARMTSPPMTWIGRIGSARKTAAIDHGKCRHEELERRHPGRAEELHGMEDDDVGKAGGERPRIEDRDDDRPSEPGQVGRGELGDPDRRHEHGPGHDRPGRRHERRVAAQDPGAEDRIGRPARGGHEREQIAGDRCPDIDPLARRR